MFVCIPKTMGRVAFEQHCIDQCSYCNEYQRGLHRPYAQLPAIPLNVMYGQWQCTHGNDHTYIAMVESRHTTSDGVNSNSEIVVELW